MNKEALRRLGELGIGVGSAWAIWQLMNSAFSYESRKKILERDGYRCVSCGSRDNLTAAHMNHDHSNPEYDNPKIGKTKCTKCHYMEHFNQVDPHVAFKGHQAAARLMWEKLDHEQQAQCPSPDMMVQKPYQRKLPLRFATRS